MICDKRSKSDSPIGKPVDCRYYVGVSSKDDNMARPIGFCQLKDEFLCIEDMEGGFPRLSYSTVSDWLDCKWKYFLKHVKGIYMKADQTSTALKCGQLWDTCVQVLCGNTDKSAIMAIINKYEIDPYSQAKVRALYRAARDLQIKFDINCQTQARFELPLEYLNNPKLAFVVTGLYDRKYSNYFVETKLSSSPDYYTNIYNITPQVSTYFLSDPAMEYCIMEVSRLPDLRSKKDADPEDLHGHCYEDIMARPAHYFIGWNKQERTYGKKFYRSEFDLEHSKKRFQAVYYEIADTAFRDAFFKNYKACYRPFQCDMMPICLFDHMSETVFEIKKKPVFCKPVDLSTDQGIIAKSVEDQIAVVDANKEIKKEK